MMPRVIFEPLAPDVQPPKRATAEAAGYDLAAYLPGGSVRIAFGGQDTSREILTDGDRPSITLEAGERALIPLGFKARIPAGYHGEVRPRSGAAFRKGLVVSHVSAEFERGSVVRTTERDGGFGSTGV